MSYIGNQSENRVSPAKMREYVTPNGSATYFDLSHDIPGYGAENLIVVVNNVPLLVSAIVKVLVDGIDCT